MNLSPIPPFTVKLGTLSYRVSFSVDTLAIMPDKGLREVITCHIAQTSPIAFYAGDCVKHPHDAAADDYYLFAKVAMKRAVAAMVADLYDDDLCRDCFFKVIYSEFRQALRKERSKKFIEDLVQKGRGPVQVFFQENPNTPFIPLGEPHD